MNKRLIFDPRKSYYDSVIPPSIIDEKRRRHNDRRPEIVKVWQCQDKPGAMFFITVFLNDRDDYGVLQFANAVKHSMPFTTYVCACKSRQEKFHLHVIVVSRIGMTCAQLRKWIQTSSFQEVPLVYPGENFDVELLYRAPPIGEYYIVDDQGPVKYHPFKYNRNFTWDDRYPPFLNPFCLVNYNNMFYDFRPLGAVYWVTQGMPRYLIRSMLMNHRLIAEQCFDARFEWVSKNMIYHRGVIKNVIPMVVRIFTFRDRLTFMRLYAGATMHISGVDGDNACIATLNTLDDIYLDNEIVFVNCANSNAQQIMEVLEKYIDRREIYCVVDMVNILCSQEIVAALTQLIQPYTKYIIVDDPKCPKELSDELLGREASPMAINSYFW